MQVQETPASKRGRPRGPAAYQAPTADVLEARQAPREVSGYDDSVNSSDGASDEERDDAEIDGFEMPDLVVDSDDEDEDEEAAPVP